MDALLNLLTGGAGGALSAIFGGLTGVVGGWLEKRHQLKIMELESSEKEKDRAHELAVMSFEAEQAAHLAEVEAKKIIAVADAELQMESYKHDDFKLPDQVQIGPVSSFLLVMVEVLRGAIRPCSTIYFQLLVTALGVWAGVVLYDQRAVLDAPVVMPRIVNMVLYLACTSTCWWFGIRGQRYKGGPK